MQTAMNKAIRAGKATTLAIGVGVVLALVLGLGTVALAAVPGDPFKIGQLNDALSAGTGLTSDRSGPTLELANTNDGSNTERAAAPPPPPPPPIPDPSSSPAPALALKVQPNQAPLTANPEAGTATGLSADELDGKDSSKFASGANGKALDADKLDGKDSAAFASGTFGKANDANLLDGKDSTAFANGTGGKADNADRLDGKDSEQFFSGRSYQVKGSEGVVGTGNGQIKFRQARCDSGDALLAGGYDVEPGDVVFFSGPDLVSFPDSGPGWLVNVQDNGLGNLMSATAYCADMPPFHQ